MAQHWQLMRDPQHPAPTGRPAKGDVRNKQFASEGSVCAGDLSDLSHPCRRLLWGAAPWQSTGRHPSAADGDPPEPGVAPQLPGEAAAARRSVSARLASPQAACVRTDCALSRAAPASAPASAAAPAAGRDSKVISRVGNNPGRRCARRLPSAASRHGRAVPHTQSCRPIPTACPIRALSKPYPSLM